MTIVDTTVWIDYLRGEPNPHTDWLDRAIERDRLGLIDLILCEVLQGTRGEFDFARTRRQLCLFEVFTTGGQDFAVASASNYLFLRARGCTIRRTIDCLIATFCLLEGHSLLHRDRDFEPFETHLGLRVVHP